MCFNCIYYKHCIIVTDEIKNILNAKQHKPLNHPSILIFSIKDWKLCIQATVSTVHHRSYARNHLDLTKHMCFSIPQNQEMWFCYDSVRQFNVNSRDEINQTRLTFTRISLAVFRGSEPEL